MRKILFIIIAIVIILLVLPFGLSKMIQSKYDNAISALNANAEASGFTFKILDYQRGWYSAKAKLEVEFNPTVVMPKHLAQQQPADLKPLTAIVEQDISNGPIILGQKNHPFTFALAVINSQVSIDAQQLKPKEAQADPVLLNARTVIYYSDALKTTFRSDNRHYVGTGKNALDVSWKAFNGVLKFPAHFQKSSGELNVDDFVVQLVVDDKTNTFTLGALNHQFKLRKNEQGLWYTTVANTDAKDIRLSSGNQVLFNLSNFNAKFAGSEQAGAFDSELDLNVDKLIVAEQSYGPIEMVMRVRGINAQILAQLHALYEQKDITPIEQQQASSKMALALASKGFDWQIKTFNMTTPWGVLGLTADVNVPKQEVPLTDFVQLEKVLNAKMNLRLAKPLAHQLAVAQQKFLANMVIEMTKKHQAQSDQPVAVPTMPSAEQIDALAQTQIDKWVEDGVLVEDKDDYQLGLALKRGELYLNDKLFPKSQPAIQVPVRPTPLLPVEPSTPRVVVPLKPNSQD